MIKEPPARFSRRTLALSFVLAAFFPVLGVTAAIAGTALGIWGALLSL